AVPESADFVLYWWNKAAELTRAGSAKRFGLITTNSLRQTFARRVVQAQLSATPPLSLLFAIPDHPWVDTAEGAAVRIAMTVGAAGEHPGELLEVTGEEAQPDGSEQVSFKSQHGKISADLTTGANVSSTVALEANEGISCPGVKLHGSGFIIEPDEAKRIGLGKIPGLKNHIRQYRNGKDLTDEPRGVMVIDLFGLSADEVRSKYPEVYQHVLTRVKPERESKGATKDGAAYAKSWWIFGKPRQELRQALVGLRRYIATVETAKHRWFEFLSEDVLPDNRLTVFATDNAFHLGVLSSRIHVTFALAAGGTLEDRPVYNKSRCFEPFPFPLCGEAEKNRIRKLAEELDAHRKRVQAQRGLTLTGLYNVLEKIRAGEKLTDKEKLIHDAGLVSVLKQLHDDLDAAVFAAYGWPATLTDAEILERLVALNAERAAEEKRGIIHWLRPEYQARIQRSEVRSQKEMDLPEGNAKPKARKSVIVNRKSAWPKSLAERVQRVESALHHFGAPATPAELAKQFKRARPADVAEILETLVTLGRARKQGGKFSR
ncbi:MAG: type IIL restriction-modification enzyme MmeI, partial [Verrucomicrobiota bacterium]